MKIKLFYLPVMLLLLLVCLYSCGPSEERTQSPASHLPPDSLPGENSAGLTEAQLREDGRFTGLLQNSGLQPHEARALGLGSRHYQLISQNAYFFEGHDSLSNFLGRCMSLAASIAPAWEENPEQLNGQTTYRRQLLIVEQIHLSTYTNCYFSDTLSRQPQGKEVTYTGYVARMQRPAPDIAYDYQLRLQQPYKEPNHPIQPGKLVQALPLTTADFEVIGTLETALAKNLLLRIRGIQYQGYAESQAIWVEAIEDPAL